MRFGGQIVPSLLYASFQCFFRGNLILQKVIQVYALQQQATLRFFDDKGKRLLWRSVHNKRNHKQVKEEYVQNILDNGVYQGVRGTPWVIAGTDCLFYHMSYATLAESVYEALERDPTNQNINITFRNGIPGAIVFTPRTPVDVLEYLKELHNNFHGGVATSFLEVYGKVDEVEAGWIVHMKANNLSSHIEILKSTFSQRLVGQRVWRIWVLL